MWLKSGTAWEQHAPRTTYQYDALGRLVKTVYDDGSYVAAAYDALGRKISSTSQLPATASADDQTNHTTTYMYDAAGNLTDV